MVFYRLLVFYCMKLSNFNFADFPATSEILWDVSWDMPQLPIQNKDVFCTGIFIVEIRPSQDRIVSTIEMHVLKTWNLYILGLGLHPDIKLTPLIFQTPQKSLNLSSPQFYNHPRKLECAVLSHWGLGAPSGVRYLGHYCLRYWFIAWSVQNHFLHQCCLTVNKCNEIFNFNQISYFYLEKHLKMFPKCQTFFHFSVSWKARAVQIIFSVISWPCTRFWMMCQWCSCVDAVTICHAGCKG